MFGIEVKRLHQELAIISQRAIICLILIAMVTGCSKNIAMKDAYGFGFISHNGANGKSKSNFQINITLSREMIKKISENELYIHIKLVGCDAGDVRATAEALLDGKRMDRFEDLRFKLQQSSQEFFTITGIVSDRMDWQSTCVTLTGGSYTLGNVRSDRVRLRWGKPGQ